jgi:hypothetical protein
VSGITEDDRIIVGPYKVLEGLKHDQKVQDERESESEEDADSEKAGPDVNDANNTSIADDSE